MRKRIIGSTLKQGGPGQGAAPGSISSRSGPLRLVPKILIFPLMRFSNRMTTPAGACPTPRRADWEVRPIVSKGPDISNYRKAWAAIVTSCDYRE